MACGIRLRSSLRDSRPFDVQPSVETLGYFRLSLRDCKAGVFPSRQKRPDVQQYELWAMTSSRRDRIPQSCIVPASCPRTPLLSPWDREKAPEMRVEGKQKRKKREFHHFFRVIGCHRVLPFGFAGASATFSTLQAHTLNSGILEIGSSARLVSRFADFLPGQ